jgi:hypothetical protein
MVILEERELEVAPVATLGDGDVRIAYTPEARLSRDGRTLWLRCAGRRYVEIDIDPWTQRAVHRAGSQPAQPFDGAAMVFATTLGDSLELCDAAGGVSLHPLPEELDQGTWFANVGAEAGEFFLCSARRLTRWSAVRNELRLLARYDRPAHEGSGFELRQVRRSRDGRTLFVRTERVVYALDAQTLARRDDALLFDVDAHCQTPGAWLDQQRLTSMAVTDDALLILTTKQHTNAKLLSIDLRARGAAAVRTLELPPDMTLYASSEPMANGCVLVSGFGHVLVDVERWSVREALRGELPPASMMTDRARSRVYVMAQGGVFVTLECAEGIRRSTRGGAIVRNELRFTTDAIVALSSAGVERFDGDATRSTVIAGTRTDRLSSLSPSGRWVLVTDRDAWVAQSTYDPSLRRTLAHSVSETQSPRALAVTDDGDVWRWDGKALIAPDGARVALSARAAWATVTCSPSGYRVALTLPKEIVVLDARARRVLCRVAAPKFARAALPNDEALVVSGADGFRWFSSADGAQTRWHKRRMTSGEANWASSPDGARLALLDLTERVEVVVRDDPSASRSFVAALQPRAAAFSPDGARLVVSGIESVLRVFDVEQALRSEPPRAPRKRATRAR